MDSTSNMNKSKNSIKDSPPQGSKVTENTGTKTIGSTESAVGPTSTLSQGYENAINLSKESLPQSILNQNLQHLIPNVGPTSLFSGKDVDEFIELYDLITAGLKSERKVKLFTRYCVSSIVDEIKWTEEYDVGNWGKFCTMLKDRYKSKKKLDPFREINKLVLGGINKENSEIFLQNFSFLTKKLIKDDYITERQKTDYLLKSVPNSVLEKLSSNLVKDGDFKPYQELAEIISDHFIAQKRMVNYKESIGKISNPETKHDSNKLGSESSIYTVKQEKLPVSPSDETNTEMLNLIKQMGAIVLTIKKSLDEGNSPQPRNFRQNERIIKCIYCDGHHSKRDCVELNEDIEKGLVKLDANKNVLLQNGEPLNPNYGNGGMKAIVKGKLNIVKSNLICINDEFENLDLNFEQHDKNVYLGNAEKSENYDVVSADEFLEIMAFANKRKLEDVPLHERVIKKSATREKEPEIEPYKSSVTEKDDFEFEPYQMKAKIVKTELQNVVLKKCKESTVTLSLEEIASISPLVRKSLNDDFRLKREVKVDSINHNDRMDLDVNWKKKYLSVGSGKKIGTIQGVRMLLMFDEGSEVNLMSETVYKGLCSLKRASLDDSIQWKMRDANSGSSNLLGVVKDVEVEIDGIKVRTSIFVSNKIDTPLILGRPWDVKSRVLKENRNDGSLWYTISDENSNKTSTFCVNTSEDTRRCEDKPYSHQIPYEADIFSLRAINSIRDWGYEPNVFTRYKSCKEKVKPISIPLSNKESPKIQEKDMLTIKSAKRLTEERISRMIFGEDNLTYEEKKLFIEEVSSCDRAFAFTQEEMGLMNEKVESPVIVETVEHEPWQVKSFPIPRGIYEEVKNLLKEKLVHPRRPKS
ncbi:hypothetical protein AYI69_g8238 [Smittium culicis]|uniref:Uncharacterized protein n=1 Tax=Smittium culicis TaxID=133412 RepID=A0A1R1XL31_9FUNG|nr:hypothetical protein AYI69_g8238 [Smittium culicis]